MCGIAGFVDAPDAAGGAHGVEAERLVRRMCDAIRHRGPDDEGTLILPGVALGMRRLSIIDLATGHQPIPNEDRTVWTVFNGELYNFRELRRELQASGHKFNTSTDTEVIVHAYEEWGVGAIARFRGMFAIAIWDDVARRLLLARDRIGIKPLYYAQHGDRLYFGSEIKSLLRSPDVPRTLDLGALDHYLSFLYTPRDGSIFESIKKLPPGHLLTWSNGKASVCPFWRFPARESFEGDESDAAAELRGILLDAVKTHLVSDVPVGAFLSGGVDSSLVVGLMAEAGHGPVRTFSIGFDEPAYDELAYARRVARRFETVHHEFVVHPNAYDILDQLISHFDEPFGDASAIPTWYVAQMARKHVTVVLSGDGGDELFGGYNRYVPHPLVAAFDRYSPAPLRVIAGAVARRMPHGLRGKNFLRHVGYDARGRYLDAIRFFADDEKTALLSDEVLAKIGSPGAECKLARHFDDAARLPWTSQMMRFDAVTYLPEDVLTKVDRMSMAHSIESRVPLLDNEVVSFAASLPATLKIRDGRRKHILKEAAASLLPRDLLDRPKQGFAVPLATWFHGKLRDVFSDTLLSHQASSRGYFRPSFVERLLREHLSGTRDHSLRLWQLVVFERWHRQYVDGV
jgi:asparagine synthase (glutamine-hydrolysing)